MIYFILLIMLVIIELTNILTDNKYYFLEKLYFLVMGMILFFIAAFRDGIGYDFISYKSIYNTIKYFTGNLDFLNIEKGFILLNKISPNFEILIILSAMLGVLIKLFIINKYSKDKILSLIIYFTSIFIMYDMGVIRQGISISIALLSIKYILDRNMMKFIGTILLACTFHITSIVFIPLYFISYKKLNRKTIYAIGLIALFLSFMNINELIFKLLSVINIPMVIFKGEIYLKESVSTVLPVIRRLIFLVIYVEFFNYKKIMDKEANLFLNAYLISIVVLSIGGIGIRGSSSLYFFEIFILSILSINISGKYKYVLRITLLIIILILGVDSMLEPINHGAITGQPYIPYNTIFD